MCGPLLLSLVVVLVLVPSATAYEVPSRLNEVAHVYSLGTGEVRCPSRAEWDADWASSFAWAYTNVREDYTVLGPVVCTGALGVGSAEVPAWQQALGALVLTHEAFHLRHWRFRRNEGKVECQALANFRGAAQRLGATAAQAEDLYPYALALHGYKVRLFPEYQDLTCVIPPWAPPSEDGLCFFTFAAPSSRVAARVAQRAGLEPLRVVEAVSSREEETGDPPSSTRFYSTEHRGEEAVADEYPLVVADDLARNEPSKRSTTRSANGSGQSAEYATSISASASRTAGSGMSATNKEVKRP